MDVGRKVYRAGLLEPLLVLAFLFQAVSGLYLAWRWSHARQDAFRTFQIASGVFLSVFILGHMNSVFVYARTYLGIPTDWAFATGAPTGLIHDPWNIPPGAALRTWRLLRAWPSIRGFEGRAQRTRISPESGQTRHAGWPHAQRSRGCSHHRRHVRRKNLSDPRSSASGFYPSCRHCRRHTHDVKE